MPARFLEGKPCSCPCLRRGKLQQESIPTTGIYKFIGMVQKIGLDKSSPYKNGGFLPLFNIFLNHANLYYIDQK